MRVRTGELQRARRGRLRSSRAILYAMPLVGSVGRRAPRAILAMTALYALLAAGAVTTLYPFALMVSTAFKGPTDQNDNKLVPSFWGEPFAVDEKREIKKESLYGKYLDDKYGGDATGIASTRLGKDATADEIRRYEALLLSLKPDYYSVGFRTQPNQVTSKLNLRYQSWLRERFKGDIDALNRAYIEENTAFQTVVPPAELLERRDWRARDTPKYRDWLVFKARLPAEFRIPVRAQRVYQAAMAGKFQNQFSGYLATRYPKAAQIPRTDPEGATKFEELALPAGAELEAFKAEKLPPRYREKTFEELWASTSSRPPPIEAYERKFVAANAAEIRGEFNSRNFRYVLDYVALHGRALWNTVIFCLLAIATQLIVNPLAAYALSRYPIRASGKILLFLLATMAFPAEVAMIPSFLLLRDLGLLNTFAALVLPTAASGYMIFLLKGFFDSLPQEVFESGQIDGAKESTLMLRMALPLSRPVLGYMALLAFMGAYGAFLYAFLVAQDQKMWTLMVWIYQLQNSAPKAVMMAAVTLAALPTVGVFLMAQRVIMRGIVLPGER